MSSRRRSNRTRASGDNVDDDDNGTNVIIAADSSLSQESHLALEELNNITGVDIDEAMAKEKAAVAAVAGVASAIPDENVDMGRQLASCDGEEESDSDDEEYVPGNEEEVEEMADEVVDVNDDDSVDTVDRLSPLEMIAAAKSMFELTEYTGKRSNVWKYFRVATFANDIMSHVTHPPKTHRLLTKTT
jgi:hypothetical protein